MSSSNPETLTSPANPTIKRLVRLRNNRYRRQSGHILVDGWRESARAIAANLPLVGCYVANMTWPTHSSPDAIAERGSIEFVLAAAANEKLVRVSESLLQRISYGQSSRGVVCEFVEPSRTLDVLDLPPDPLLLVLDAIEKPGNVGAVFRCADAAGVDAVILSSCDCDLHNPNAIRASLGAVFSVAAAVANREQVHAFLSKQKIPAIAARVESSQPLGSIALRPPLAIILGSEADGLGSHWKTLEGNEIPAVRIPMRGLVDSLNVSVSAALLAYEARR